MNKKSSLKRTRKEGTVICTSFEESNKKGFLRVYPVIIDGVNFGLCGDVPWRKKYATEVEVLSSHCSCTDEDSEECFNERDYYRKYYEQFNVRPCFCSSGSVFFSKKEVCASYEALIKESEAYKVLLEHKWTEYIYEESS